MAEPTAGETSPRPPRSPARRAFGPAMLVAALAGIGLAITGTKPWAEVDQSGRAASALLEPETHSQMPAVTALALLTLASWGVLLVTRGAVRRVFAGIALAVALAAAVAAVLGWRSATETVEQAYRDAGLDGVQAASTQWPLLALVAAVLQVVTAAAAVIWCRDWPEMGRRYDAPTSTTSAHEAPASPPEQRTAMDLWKDLDAGHDPTDRPGT